jgi:divalent metal cation (Fe/Co/Zn/Cd) transporter
MISAVALSEPWRIMSGTTTQDRALIVISGKRVEYFSIFWHLLEGVISLGAGISAGSLSLVGFGADSLVELASSLALLWRMKVDQNVEHRERNEQLALRIVGFSFIALALYLILESIVSLVQKKAPEHSIVGIVMAVLSLAIMPLLSRAKRQIGLKLGSAAMCADAKQADFCAYLAAILLAGLLLNFWFNWWWADPIAAIAMALIIGHEGINASTGQRDCC